MKITTLGSLALLLLTGTSCNLARLTGSEECTDSSNCTGPRKDDETVIMLGGGGSAFDPKGDGSTGVALDPKGNIVLDPRGGTGLSQSVIWVANSGDGTVSKIDTRTGVQLSRYTTYPGGAADPSRTTVSLGGDMVVANRAWQNGADGSQASAVKIAGEKSTCIDRNKNGKIDTFEGTGPIPAAFQWKAGMADSPDECVLWLTKLTPSTLPRGAAWDAEIGEGYLSLYVYVALFQTSEVWRIDGRNGNVVKKFNVAPNMPYGLVIDKDGNVWAMGRESAAGSLAKIATRKGDAVKVYPGPDNGGTSCNYGITADSRGYIYTAFNNCVGRFNPTSESWEYYNIPGAQQLRGVAIDNKMNLWVADSQVGMHHVDISAMPPGGFVFKKTVSTPGTNAGAAIDADNNAWTIAYDPANKAYKIDPSNYQVTTVPGFSNPYTYSDMTGYQLRNASRAGTYRTTFAGCTDGVTTWNKLIFSSMVPTGSAMTIRYRAADSIANLPSAMWVSVTGVSPVSIMLPPTPNPRYLQVEVNMSSVDPAITPVLSGLSASYTCRLIIG